MIFDGFILMVVGMLVVYFFLIIMNTIIKMLSASFRDHALQEEKALLDEAEAKRRKKREKEMKKAVMTVSPSADEASRMTAVITAAAHAHATR